MSETEHQTAALQFPAFVAFHGDLAIKETYLKRVREHAAADQLVQGYGYWKDGKGCAVGCTLHSGSHAAYETELGLPRALAHLEDRIFEGLPVEEARSWPERFLAAARPGADLSAVPWRMVQWLLTSEVPATTNPDVEALRGRLLALFEPLARGAPFDRAAFRALLPEARAIRDGAWAVRRKALDALDAAAVAAAAEAAVEAATAEAAAAAVAVAVAEAVVAEAVVAEAVAAEAAAAEAAAAAAAAAEAAAVVAAAAAAAAAEAAAVVVVAAAVVAAYWGARRQSYVRQSEKLLELMSAAG
jgi:hypothetical protein